MENPQPDFLAETPRVDTPSRESMTPAATPPDPTASVPRSAAVPAPTRRPLAAATPVPTMPSLQPLPPTLPPGDRPPLVSTPTRSVPPLTPESMPPVFSADEALRSEGSIAFNTPEEMTRESSHMIQLLLDPGALPEALEGKIVERGKVDSARIRISDTVEAKLTGSAFEIRPVTPEVQAVSAWEPTEWRWEVVPKETGTHRMFLTINALVPSEGGSERRRAIRTFDRAITVVVQRKPLESYLVPAAIVLVIASMIVIVVLDWRRRRRAGSAVPVESEDADAAGSGGDVATLRDTVSPLPHSPPLVLTRTLAPGDVVAGRYVIDRLLGRGGMGAVYAAEDRELGEKVALKTMLPATAIDERSLGRFRREIQYARRVAHPNVCRIHDLGQHRVEGVNEPLVFVSMELVDGMTLSSLLHQKERLSEAEAMPIVTQIAAGLEATHAAGLIHRDLKPSNVMLTNDQTRIVLMDFGLARLSAPATGELSITETGAIVGSPVYMAPEQLEDGEVSPATDIYAFGAVIYEMVTGRRPFDSDSPISLIAQRLHGQPIPPSARWPGISPPWEQTILRCLARQPEDRFQSAREVERALRSAMSDDVTLEIPPGR